MTNFEDHWTQVLQSAEDAGDILASIREEAINHYLAKHFQLDNPKYSVSRVVLAKVDDQGVSKDLPVTITVQAKSSMVVDFTPFAAGAGSTIGGRWTELQPPEAPPSLSDGNVRISVQEIAFSLEWPSVYEQGKSYSWKPSPIRFEAEAYIRLSTIDEPVDESRHILQLQLVRARFARPQRALIERELNELIGRLPAEDRAIVIRHAVDKFDELLVIALNTAAVEVAPRFAASIEIPVPVVAQKRLIPRALLISDNVATVSFGLSEMHLRANAEAFVESSIAEVKLALEEDIASAGGLRSLVVKEGQNTNWDSVSELRALEIRGVEEIAAKLTRTAEIAARQQEKCAVDILAADVQAMSVGAAVVRDGVGIAFNEYLLDSIAATFPRSSPEQCTAWIDLAAVRGRACYWARIFDADLSIGQAAGKLKVAGTVDVDIGGSLEGCVRKFWDCSWRWACEELRMAIKGRPGIELTLLQSKFIAMSATIIGQLTLETNLPFPFNKVAEAIGSLVWAGVKAILNAFLRHVQIVLVPPVLVIPKQSTAIALSDFAPRYFPYIGGTDSKKRFAAFSVGVTAQSS